MVNWRDFGIDALVERVVGTSSPLNKPAPVSLPKWRLQVSTKPPSYLKVIVVSPLDKDKTI